MIQNSYSQGVADKTLMGYWHNWGPMFRLTEIPNDYNIISIAFALSSDAKGNLYFNPNYDANLFKQDIVELQQAGRKVIISIGGEGGQISLDTEFDKNNFIQTLTTIVEEYNFDGVDIDLEGSSIAKLGDVDFKNPTRPTSVNFLDAMDAILNYFGDEFLLTAVPETYYVQAGYKGIIAEDWDIDQKLKGSFFTFLHKFHDRIDFLAVQLYNSGGEYGLDNKIHNFGSAEGIVSATHILLHGIPVGGLNKPDFAGLEWIEPFRPDQILIGIPASVQAAGSGYVDDQEINKALDALILGETDNLNYKLSPKSGYPDLGGLMTWSINWDRDDRNYGFANNFTTYLSKLSSLTLKFDQGVSFGEIDAYRNYSKIFSITNYTGTVEQINLSDISNQLTIDRESFLIEPGKSESFTITLNSHKIGPLSGQFTCNFSNYPSSQINVSANVGCFTIRGNQDAFDGVALSNKWIPTNQYLLSQENGRLKVVAQKLSNVWDSFSYTFDQVDLSKDLNVSFDFESEVDMSLRVDLVDVNGNVSSYNPAIASYLATDGVRNFELDFTDRMESWPDRLVVDGSKISKIYIHANAGATYQGTFFIDNFTVGNPDLVSFASTAIVCSDMPYIFGNQTLNTSGNYTEVLSTKDGCDSLVHLSLTVLPVFNSTKNIFVCDGEQFILGQKTLSQTGTYTEVFQAQNGCDSTVVVVLTVNPEYNESTSIGICQGESIDFGNQSISSEGQYVYTFQSKSSCDSIVTLDVSISPVFNEEFVASVCDGKSYSFGSNTYSNSGQYTELFLSKNGCDSSVTLNLTIEPNNLNPMITVSNEMLSVNEAGADYQWINCDLVNQIIDGQTNSSFTPVKSGNYAVMVTKDGCDAISDCITFTAPLGNLSFNEISIFPNPTYGNVFVDFGRVIKLGRYELIGIDGNQHQSGPIINQSNLKLDINTSGGIYILKLVDVNGVTSIGRFIKY